MFYYFNSLDGQLANSLTFSYACSDDEYSSKLELLARDFNTTPEDILDKRRIISHGENYHSKPESLTQNSTL